MSVVTGAYFCDLPGTEFVCSKVFEDCWACVSDLENAEDIFRAT